jgi:hypothetical protein
MRTTFLITAGAILAVSVPVSADSLDDVVKASLLRQASLSYGTLLSGGVAAGRLYSREATVSGAKRHAAEFLARQYVPATRTSSAE